MTCWAVIPAKPPAESKQRLAAAMPAEARERLVRAMLDHVLATVGAAGEVERCMVLGGDGIALPSGVSRIPDCGGGLNPALQAMLDDSRGGLPDRLIVIHGDLPRLTAADVQHLAELPQGVIGIAPDRNGTGTNALSLPLPAARKLRFAFGAGSFARHLEEADRLVLPVEVLVSDGLGCDIDEPADLANIGQLADNLMNRVD